MKDREIEPKALLYTSLQYVELTELSKILVDSWKEKINKFQGKLTNQNGEVNDE